MVEHLTCNQTVVGSIPTTSSIFYGKFAERPNATDCKSVDFVFGGSNPPLPTKKRTNNKFVLFFTSSLFTNHSSLKYIRERMMKVVTIRTHRTVVRAVAPGQTCEASFPGFGWKVLSTLFLTRRPTIPTKKRTNNKFVLFFTSSLFTNHSSLKYIRERMMKVVTIRTHRTVVRAVAPGQTCEASFPGFGWKVLSTLFLTRRPTIPTKKVLTSVRTFFTSSLFTNHY